MSVKKMPPPPRLRVEGLKVEPVTAVASPDPLGKPAPPPAAGRRERFRATVVLPAPFAERLRERSRATQRTQGDLILSALLAHYRTVADQVGGADAERAALGLPPVRPPKPKGPPTQLSVTMSEAGRSRLDADAGRLGLGRSALVLAVLAAELGDGE